MGDLEKAAGSTRLKREDCQRTKHDPSFSDWKILVGHSDWEDHELSKEGAEQYRTQNLPDCSSCPGVYELGIVKSRPRSGRQVGKLDKDSIIPVYLGQSDNVRTRLQRYGRDGAHLENGNSLGKGLGLFKEAFSEGFSIVYRWAPMSKRDAEKTEAQLLDKFDYAWNKGSNSTRRPHDILNKLDQNTSVSSPFHQISRKFQNFPHKKVEVSSPLLPEEKNDFLPQILEFGRSRSGFASVKTEDDESRGNICGVALGRWSVCRRPPVEGRKRCEEHKGMKVVDGMTSKSIADATEEDESGGNICGVALGRGSVCRRPPVEGRKRCEEHKGMKIVDGMTSKSIADATEEDESGGNICGVALGRGSVCRRPPVEGRKRCPDHKGMKGDGMTSNSIADEKLPFFRPWVKLPQASPVCGVLLCDGSPCTNEPAPGRRRCEEHKGMRVGREPVLESNFGQKFSVSPQSVRNSRAFPEPSQTCGAALRNGSFCRRKVKGGRCWQH